MCSFQKSQTVPARVFAAFPDLLVSGRRVLLFGAKPGVDCAAGSTLHRLGSVETRVHLAEVADQYDIAAEISSRHQQPFAVRRPIEIENTFRSKVRQLLRHSPSKRLLPYVRRLIPSLQIVQACSIGRPPHQSRQSLNQSYGSASRDGNHGEARSRLGYALVKGVRQKSAVSRYAHSPEAPVTQGLGNVYRSSALDRHPRDLPRLLQVQVINKCAV